MTRLFALIALTMTCGRALAGDAATDLQAADWAMLDKARIVIVGEVHDNPQHHETQAQIVDRLQPESVVFEMLSPQQVVRITPESRRDEQALREALDWENSGWPDFAMYYPIFAAAPEAAIHPALLSRDAARAVMQDGTETVFGGEAGLYGLTEPLDADQQTAREAMQMSAHCDALPAEMLPAMVQIQRLRDAVLARAALTALDETDGTVVVITGNGHARADWGVPVYLEAARPGLPIVTIGQGEDGRAPDGRYDIVLTAPAPTRGDPCDAFQ
jgi:uncharacterized iron-regulated protein